MGPASRLADFAKECKERKKRSFSSYKTLKDLKEVLAKYGIDGNGIGAIRQFPPTILHASLYIVKRITEKEITLTPQLEVVGEENTGHVDYAVKALEELICITEGRLYQVVMGFAQNLVQCESALQLRIGISSYMLQTEYLSIRFTKSALKEGSEEEKELFRNVKRVIEVVVGLLKDWVDVDKEPAMKKQRVQEYFEKK
ncbi:hypothetical protein RirG_164280 [Rhizophagus irregularis DAOM 197198w]|uniref:Uncharacterized protein n=2 Tax=Rhizophagus irregularis TaxID=588596 RepID=A0A015M5U6_RHIIW|nr:hypothetical protein RirG_164280 [Rhizophagus irregularis DAOM 197198w]